MSLRERCHCGCDKTSHYRDAASGVRGACLNHRCDCERYVNEFEPLPAPEPPTQPSLPFDDTDDDPFDWSY